MRGISVHANFWTGRDGHHQLEVACAEWRGSGSISKYETYGHDTTRGFGSTWLLLCMRLRAVLESCCCWFWSWICFSRLRRLVVRVAYRTACPSSIAVVVSACLGLGQATRRRWIDSSSESPRCDGDRGQARTRQSAATASTRRDFPATTTIITLTERLHCCYLYRYCCFSRHYLVAEPTSHSLFLTEPH